jgi:hemoglobin/transferrin/lactoferrin receptor protein
MPLFSIMQKGLRSLFLLGFLFAFSTLTAQKVVIVDAETQEPLRFVTITSDEPKAFASSNQKGEADLTPFNASPRITFKSLGYKRITLSYEELRAMGFRLNMSLAAVSFDEVVVSATRFKKSSRVIPQKISTIRSSDIAMQNPQTAADLLAVNGEVMIQKSQQGGGSPMIRGFAANRLLYAVDGVRMNNAIFRAGNVQQVISLNPFTIETAEVLFGPGSVMYGSDAIGGVMHFTTLMPRLSKDTLPTISGLATTRFSSANQERSGHFQLNAGWKKWAFLTSFSQNQYGDLRMGRRGPDEFLRPFYVSRMDSTDVIVTNNDPLLQVPTGFTQTHLMQKVRYSPGQNFDIQYGFYYSETSPYSRYDRLIEVNSAGLPTSAVWNYGPQVWMMNLLSLTHRDSNKLYDQMAVKLSWQQFEESRINRNFSGGQRFRLREQLESVNAYAVNVDFEKRMGTNTLTYGFESVFNQVASSADAIDIRNNNNIPVAARYPNSTWQSHAAFASLQSKLTHNLTLHTGARYSWFGLQSDFSSLLEFQPLNFSETQNSAGQLTGLIGIIYQPNHTWRLHLNGSSGFRAPNVDDIGKLFDFVAGSVIMPNPELLPEYAYNMEAGVSKFFNEYLKLELIGYYTWLDNAIVRRAGTFNGQDSLEFNGIPSQVFTLQNAAYSQVIGGHAGFEWFIDQHWRLSTRFNYQRGIEEMEDGSRSPSRHAAPAFGMTRLTYTLNNVSIQAYAMYSAGFSFDQLNEEERQKPHLYAIDDQGRPFSPAWYTLNLKAMVPIGRQLLLSAGLENITDIRYRTYSSGLTAPGRNFIVSVTGNF